MSLRLRSPAKINLFLHVRDRREDGYHNLSSLIQTISFFDDILIAIDECDQFSCSIPKLENSQNLALQARDLFRLKTGWKDPVAIKLNKQIPLEAGLGGGSGNAATILWGLNELSGLKVPEATLQAWSAELGSDIPFFFSHGTALCEGRGEIVSDLPPLPRSEVTLIKPPQSLKTPDVFRAYQPQPQSDSRSADRLKEILDGRPHYENDLEPAAFSLAPELAAVKEALLALTPYAAMTGSGSSFFCLGHHSIDLGMPMWTLSFHHRQSGEWYS